MNGLFIDTHMSKIDIVLFHEGNILNKKSMESSQSHSIYTMPLVDSILKESSIEPKEINEIYVVNGPGSFTGVRIGVTIAKTLAFALNIKIKTISSLELKNISSNVNIVVVSDKNGKYVGEFLNNKLIGEFRYMKNNEFTKWIGNKEYVDDIDIDYERIYDFMQNIGYTNVHKVNPVYIKDIGVVNG